MKKLAKISKTLYLYETAGLNGVKEYLLNPDTEIPIGWLQRIKDNLELNNYKSIEAEIKLMLFNYNLGKPNERKK